MVKNNKRAAANKRLSSTSAPSTSTVTSPQKRSNSAPRKSADSTSPTAHHSDSDGTADGSPTATITTTTATMTSAIAPPINNNAEDASSDDKDAPIRVLNNRDRDRDVKLEKTTSTASTTDHTPTTFKADSTTDEGVSNDDIKGRRDKSTKFPSPFISGSASSSHSFPSHTAPPPPKTSDSSGKLDDSAGSDHTPAHSQHLHNKQQQLQQQQQVLSPSRALLHNVALSQTPSKSQSTPSSNHHGQQNMGHGHPSHIASPHHHPIQHNPASPLSHLPTTTSHHAFPPISPQQHQLSQTNYLTTSPSVKTLSTTPSAANSLSAQPSLNNNATNTNKIPTTLPDDLPSPQHPQTAIPYISPMLSSPQQFNPSHPGLHGSPNPHQQHQLHPNLTKPASQSPGTRHTVATAALTKMSPYHNDDEKDPRHGAHSPTLSTTTPAKSPNSALPQKLNTTPSPVSTANTYGSKSSADPQANTHATPSTSGPALPSRRPSVSTTTTPSTVRQVPASTLVNHTYRLMVIGSEGCGKTSLLRRFASNAYTPQYLPTIGVDFLTSTFVSNAGNSANSSNGNGNGGGVNGATSGSICTKLHIWDSSGSPRFSSLIPSYLKDCSVCLLAFDLTSIESYHAVFEQYLPSIRHNYGDNIIIIAVGCKSDLTRQRVIGYEEIKAETKKYSLPYLETSSKTGNNVSILFSQIASILPEIDSSNNPSPQGGGKASGAGAPSLDDAADMNRSGTGSADADGLHADEGDSRSLCFWKCW